MMHVSRTRTPSTILARLSISSSDNTRTISKTILQRWSNSPIGQKIKAKAIKRSIEACQNGKPVISPPLIHFPDLAQAEVLPQGHYSPLRKLYEMAQRSPDEIFIIKGNKKYTYSQVLEESRKVAQGLANRGIGYGDSVGTMFFPDELEFFTSFFGIEITGAVPILANYLSPETIPKKLDESNARTLIIGRHWELRGGANNLSFAGLLERVITVGQIRYPKSSLKDSLNDLGNFVKMLFDKSTYNSKSLIKLVKRFLGIGFYNPFANTYNTLRKDGTYDDNQFILNPPQDAPQVVIFSSNTSGGGPKRITDTNLMIAEATKRVTSCIKLKKDDKMLFCVPPNHLAALIVFFGALSYECPLVLTDIPKGSDPRAINNALNSMIDNEVTVLPAVPKIVQNILSEAWDRYEKTGDRKYLLENICLIFSGSEELKDEVIELVRKFNNEREKFDIDPIELVDFYAATETGPISYAVIKTTKSGYTRTMRPFDGIEVKLKNDETTGKSEILVRGPRFSISEISSDRFVGGFYKTHDIGAMNGDSNIQVSGRIDDVWQRGGENIMPTDVLPYIKEINEISECFAFAVHHNEKQEYVACAVVIPKDGVEINEEYVLNKLRSSGMSELFIPHVVFVEKELPKEIVEREIKSPHKTPLLPFKQYYEARAIGIYNQRKGNTTTVLKAASEPASVV